MSLVDVRFPDLDLFLQTWQRRLNRRFLTGEAFVAAAVSAPLGTVVALLGWNDALRWWVASAVLVVGVAGYTLVRARSRLSKLQAASWLDEATGTQGLFRAAAECLTREPLTAAEHRVLTEAERRCGVLHGARGPRLPWRRWLGRLALALVVGSAASAPLVGNVPSLLPPAGAETVAKTAPRGTPTLPDNPSRQLTPKEAAERLFPEDARLAALAEQALASGDPGALESLLEQNADRVNPAGRPSGSGSSPQNGGNGNAREGEGQGQSSPDGGPPSAGQSPRPGAGESSSGGRSSQPGTSPSNPDAQRPAPSSGAAPGAGAGQNRSGDSRSGDAGQGGNSNALGKGGGAPGQGHSDAPRGPAEATGSNRKLTLKDPSAQGLFEYVLPGSEAALPTAQTLADSRRSAEAVLSRTSPPLEYENAIREYFLSLSQLPLSQEVSR